MAAIGGAILLLDAAAPFDPDYREVVRGCRAVDGDSLVCAGGERIRLLAIDAPEIGACQPGRRCVSGDGAAAADALRAAVDPSAMAIARVGRDRHGRTVAAVRSGEHDLSCHMIRDGFAVYRGDWDDGGRVFRTCLAERLGMGRATSAP